MDAFQSSDSALNEIVEYPRTSVGCFEAIGSVASGCRPVAAPDNQVNLDVHCSQLTIHISEVAFRTIDIASSDRWSLT